MLQQSKNGSRSLQYAAWQQAEKMAARIEEDESLVQRIIEATLAHKSHSTLAEELKEILDPEDEASLHTLGNAISKVCCRNIKEETRQELAKANRTRVIRGTHDFTDDDRFRGIQTQGGHLWTVEENSNLLELLHDPSMTHRNGSHRGKPDLTRVAEVLHEKFQIDKTVEQWRDHIKWIRCRIHQVQHGTDNPA